MACYNHVEKTEICTCTYCGKHLCQDCHKKIEGCLVCKTGECGVKAAEVNHFHEGGHCHHLFGRQFPFLSGIIHSVAAVLLLWIGYHFYTIEDYKIAVIVLIVGLLAAVESLFCFYRRHKMTKMDG